jgi:RHS repeat-associated protein
VNSGLQKQAAPEASTTEKPFGVSAPSPSLPKGGGAIKGIGEKFASNPVSGTGSMTIPIPTSPGRSDFGPQLALSYDSGAGNGPFGLGWDLSLPSITRKTDKGLPQYADAEDSDVFLLSAAEDLVPVYRQDATGGWLKDAADKFVVHEDLIDGYRVRRYRPRVEGLFARIERWTRASDPSDVHWRSITRENLLTIYGLEANSRIQDPEDARRIFGWLICETRDDKGNAILYRYKAEDGWGADLTKASERNRGAANDPRRAANRYLKHVYYGNRTPLLDTAGSRPRFLDPVQIDAQIVAAGWMFEVLLDYGEHDPVAPTPDDAGAWEYRIDPFSSYRPGFEVRTTRRCRRILIFHHFPDEAEVGVDCLVRSVDLAYSDQQNPADDRSPIYTFLCGITQTGYRRATAGYTMRSLPTVEFEYSKPVVQDAVREIDASVLDNLPIGPDGTTYQWTDLHGEGIPGILTEQGGAWFYKRNLSPIGETPVEFAAVECVATKPNLALGGGSAQFMDLAGDGLPDLVVFDGAISGRYEHDETEGWQSFRPFTAQLSRDTRDPNLKFVDLDGDGRADVLITENDAFVWHRSLAEDGFGPARRIAPARDEEKGPRLVFADGEESIYLADCSGDGLTDLVRIRNGEVCFWPNLGYGRFGAKVTMDHAPRFDSQDQFDQKRIRLADIDGSGTTDILYLHRDGVRIYFNQCGNSWSAPQHLGMFPRVDELASIVPTDLFGNGTACLVWSSPLLGEARRQMRYVDLMGGQKPHLLTRIANNLGAETRIHYASSTKFYLQDKRAGRPWITRLPFPVHVVEKVETFDWIGRNRSVNRYAYHHGYFDGVEREFRGFGMVEQWDTERLGAFGGSDEFPPGDNLADESHVPPVHTKTWFHTGAYLGREHVSDFFAGLLNATDLGEYFREPGLSDAEARALLLPDTLLPAGMTLHEEREACRALKGQMLRQEIYALDGSDKEPFPYSVAEQNFTVRPLQPTGANRYGVFFTHARETIEFHYERNPADPRIEHALTLEVDEAGNVLKSATVGYGRRATVRVVDTDGDVLIAPNPGLVSLLAADQSKQTTALATYSENRVTNTVETIDTLRGGMLCETCSFELTGYTPTGPAGRFQFSDLVAPDPDAPGRLRHVFLNEFAFEQTATGARARRLIEQTRTLFRSDALTGLLPLGQLESLGLSGESYKLAFTPSLIAQVFQRPLSGAPAESLLPDPSAVLGGQGGDRGGYVPTQMLKADGRFPASDPNDRWWIGSGRTFFSEDPADPAPIELTNARQHFFIGRRYRDAFGQDTTVRFDSLDLLTVETRDPLGNLVTVEANDYRILQPSLMSDANRNRIAVAFDALGQVAGTAVMGKPLPAAIEGDSLESFLPDLTLAQIDSFFAAADPTAGAPALLQNASTRIVYDLDRFSRTRKANPDDPALWLPPCSAMLARETHASDPLPPEGLKIQLNFFYSDGFGREIQTKLSAEPGPVVDGGAVVAPRWVGSGWTIFNNKGEAIRRYEPFFSGTHQFEFGVQRGVSPVLFYDPIGRVVATLQPNHSYLKVVFDSWQQISYDANDTCAARNLQTGDPRSDPDIGGLVARYFTTLPVDPAQPWQTWHQQRIGGARGEAERTAAIKAAAHADTPTTIHCDVLGRTFLTITRNRVVCPNHPLDGTEEAFSSRVELDIKGATREVRDANQQASDPRGRIVIRYAYDLTGKRLFQLSMEAGARWDLNDVSGKSIRAWDERGHNFATVYDALRRPLQQFVRGTTTDSDPHTFNADVLVDRIEYGETHPDAAALNLRKRVLRHWDSAGLATSLGLNPSTNQPEAYDFKGNLLRCSRQFVSDYKAVPDWSQSPALDAEIFTSSGRYNALNLPVQKIAPHRNSPGARINVIQPVFNEANLLERMDVWLGRTAEPTGLLNPAVETPAAAGVSNLDYDAKGQRERIDYKNGASTFYDYDPLTFRLASLKTRRNVSAFPADNPQPPPADWPGGELQNLSYVYDPAGNIVHLRDDAQQSVFFNNRRVEPSNAYTYDANYRLIEATGREHLGQTGAGVVHSFDDAGRVGVPSGDASGLFSATDGNAMGAYLERYVYDAVGNFLEMQHRRTDAASPGWTRNYAYSETSLVETGAGGTLLKTSNRLSSTSVGGNSETYQHDIHGNLVRLPHLGAGAPGSNLEWNYRNQLRRADLGGGGAAYCVYDAAGQRVRKVWEKSARLIEERIYLGGFEISRRHRGAIGPGTATRERETLHVMDDVRRIALVETRTLDLDGDDPAPLQLTRYQLNNHLGSASLELDDAAQIISYEEYTPYGSSSYQAVRNQTDTAKRYRYAGKERDEETGLGYHGARYYAPWLGRWTATDPSGIEDGLNIYAYGHANPVVFVDPDGNKNVPSNATETEIKDMTDPQLRQKMEGMTKAQRGAYASSASGWFGARAWATLNKYHLEWEILAPAPTTTTYTPQGPPAPEEDPPADDDAPAEEPNSGYTGNGGADQGPDYSGSIMPDGTGSPVAQPGVVVFVYDSEDATLAKYFKPIAEDYENSVPATNWEDAMKGISEIAQEKGPISVIYIADHGAGGACSATGNAGCDGIHQLFGGTFLEQDDYAQLAPLLTSDATVVLTGCNVGANEAEVQATADTMSATVISTPASVQWKDVLVDQYFVSAGEWMTTPPTGKEPTYTHETLGLGECWVGCGP